MPSNFPFTIVAVITTVPAAVVFRVYPLILAPVVPALLTVHTMALLVATIGSTLGVKVRGIPAWPDVGTPEMLLTETKVELKALLNVMVKSCVYAIPCALPLAIVAVTVTVPAAVVFKMFPMILAPVVPALLTVHAMVLLVALDGTTVPTRVMAATAVPVVGMPMMLVTGTKLLLIVIVKSLVYAIPCAAPFAIVAVTVTVPAAVVFSVLPLMYAPVVPALLTDHAMVLLVALEGETVPERVRGVPAVPVVGMPEMLVTGTIPLLFNVLVAWFICDDFWLVRLISVCDNRRAEPARPETQLNALPPAQPNISITILPTSTPMSTYTLFAAALIMLLPIYVAQPTAAPGKMGATIQVPIPIAVPI